jgi:hypothetical protein
MAKKNYCEIDFRCTEPDPKKCAYFSREDTHIECRYMNLHVCDSKVAQANKMVLLLKKWGLHGS